MVNKIFTCVNVLVLGFIMVSGFVKGYLHRIPRLSEAPWEVP